MAKKHFYVRLIPPRPTFASDMTQEERAIMQEQVSYCSRLFQDGNILIFGPVLDPGDNFGMAVFEADDESTVHSLLENDPSVRCGLNHLKVAPMVVAAAGARAIA